jgi:hypothetical protein
MLPIPDLGRWWAALLLGLMLLILLLIGAWLLRIFVPVAPTIILGAVQMSPPIAPVSLPDPTLALKASLDDILNVEKGLKAELASRQADLRKRLEQCKPSEPSLPAERWSRGDLGTLKGCWVLGRDVPMVHSFADGRKERVTIKASRICFDNQGGGLHDQVTIGPTARWNCEAPITAKFWSNGTLVANQPAVVCEGEPPMRWAATQFTCRRATDEMALCQAVDKSGRTQVEFRRER